MKTPIKKFISIIVCSFGFIAYTAASQEPPQVQTILDYWFGDLNNGEVYPDDKAPKWFGEGKDIDNDIRNHFGDLVIAAAKNKLVDWKETPKGRLALIILIDQFTRNIYTESICI